MAGGKPSTRFSLEGPVQKGCLDRELYECDLCIGICMIRESLQASGLQFDFTNSELSKLIICFRNLQPMKLVYGPVFSAFEYRTWEL